MLKRYDFKIIENISYNDGRFLLLHAQYNGTELIFVNIYAPTKDHKQDQIDCFNFVKDTLERFMGKVIIIGGDFNTYLNPSLDKSGVAQKVVRKVLTFF